VTLLAVVLAMGIALIAGLVGLGAWLSARRTLRSVEVISTDLREIATDLSQRVRMPPRQNEIARLAESINATLDRLEASVARQRGFVSDVSHELRSPLTGLRTELELALTDPVSGDTRESLEAALRGTDRLHEVIADLLAIARLDAHAQPLSEAVDLHAVADMEVLRVRRRATVTVVAPDHPVIVKGGQLELARVMTNLIDNADRHAKSQVLVTIRTEPGWAIVEVADDGAGIPREDRDRIFQRSTSLTDKPHQDAGGTGLGLAIACEIAIGHGGTLVLAEGRPGARFVLRLPREEPGPQAAAQA
jgi:signal transduction histidine kinase